MQIAVQHKAGILILSVVLKSRWDAQPTPKFQLSPKYRRHLLLTQSPIQIESQYKALPQTLPKSLKSLSEAQLTPKTQLPKQRRYLQQAHEVSRVFPALKAPYQAPRTLRQTVQLQRLSEARPMSRLQIVLNQGRNLREARKASKISPAPRAPFQAPKAPRQAERLQCLSETRLMSSRQVILNQCRHLEQA